MNRKLSALLALLLCVTSPAYAQVTNVEISKKLNYEMPETPAVFDNYSFIAFSAAGKRAYNMKGFDLAKTPDPIISIKANPAGSSFAVLTSNPDPELFRNNKVRVFKSWRTGDKLHDFKLDIVVPSAMEFSADGRSLYVCDMTGDIYKYDSKFFKQQDKWKVAVTVNQLEASGNGYYLAAVSNQEIIIINPSSRNFRTTLSFDSPVLDVSFSKDGSLLAALTETGEINVYDTRTFNLFGEAISCPGATSITLHPDNKYIAVARDSNAIDIINIVNNFDTTTLVEPDGNLTTVKFVQDGKDNTYLAFNGKDMLKYRLIKGLVPNYSQFLRAEITDRMAEWSRMKADETEDEYFARMTDESRLNQMRLIEEEVATRMADDLVMSCDIKLGAYNQNDGTLTLEFDKMPAVFITVPQDEMSDFMDTGNLEFRNAIYGLTQDDKFELVYADVYNRSTGKTYVFNNRQRKSLDYLYSSDDFVPIELVKVTGMQEVALTDIRNSIVEKAMEDKLISGHTHIDVSTNISTDTDAEGKKITNYAVGFKYTVDGDFSSVEDFSPGKYNIDNSPAASSMLKIITEAFESDFAQYIVPGKKLIMKISGSADATPIRGALAYDGSFGEYFEEPYTLGKNLSTISLSKKEGIRTNEQLAFTRALAVKDFINKNLPQLEDMDTEYLYKVEVSDKKGSEYRRIEVEFIFVDAFN